MNEGELAQAWAELRRDIEQLMQGQDITITASGVFDHAETQARHAAAQAVVSWFWVRLLSKTVQKAEGNH